MVRVMIHRLNLLLKRLKHRKVVNKHQQLLVKTSSCRTRHVYANEPSPIKTMSFIGLRKEIGLRFDVMS